MYGDVMSRSSLVRKIRSVRREALEVLALFKDIYVMFSGGRDSLVTLHLISEVLGKANVKALFIDTGISTPGLIEYVRDTCKRLNIELTVVKPRYDFFKLVKAKGFPIIKRRWCKEYLKIRPLKEWISRKDVKDVVLVTGIRRDESWMKSRAFKLYYHPKFKTTTYAPIFEWSKSDVINYLGEYGLEECPLYKTYGKAYDCWCTVYKSPSDFAVLALNNPEFFRKFVEAEKELRKGGSALYYGGKRIYLRDVARNPKKYLEKYPRKYICPLCRTLLM